MNMGRQFTVKARDVSGERRDPPRLSKLLLSEASVGVSGLSMGLNITEVGSMIPDHFHEKEEECMFLISGKARFIIEGLEFDLEPETAFYAPPGMTHRIVNVGDEPLKILWVYSPPLPAHKGR